VAVDYGKVGEVVVRKEGAQLIAKVHHPIINLQSRPLVGKGLAGPFEELLAVPPDEAGDPLVGHRDVPLSLD